MASVVVIEYFVQLPDHQRRPYTGKQGPPAPKDKKQKGEEKLADGCFQIPVTSAQQQQQSPEGPKSRVTLRDLKWHFPFEGDFHFRARIYSKEQQQVVWLDLRKDSESVHLTKPQYAFIKVLPLFEVDEQFAENVQRFPYTPQQWRGIQRQLQLMAASETPIENQTMPKDTDQSAPFYEYTERRNDTISSVQTGAKNAWEAVSKKVDTEKFRSASSYAWKTLGGVFKKASKYVKESMEGGESSEGFDTSAGDGLYPTEFALANLNDIHTDFNARFKPEFPPHEVLLETLWENLLPDEEYTRVSPQWQVLGFQQDDPSYDFRGGGILSLKCLVYMSKEHKTQTRSMLFSGDLANKLPFALASINLTAALAKLLGIAHFTKSTSRRRSNFWPLFEDSNAFYELHFIALLALIDEWTAKDYEVNSDAFPKVLDETRGKVRRWLAQGPLTIDDLKKIAERMDNIQVV